MNKKVIGIDINEVLRARWLQFDKFYVDEFGEDGAPPEEEAYVYDFFGKYKWEDLEEEVKYLNEDLPEDINPIHYQVDENGKSDADTFLFDTKIEKLTAKEVYNRFLYKDFCFEIHASAPKIYPAVDRHAEKFYMEFKDQFEVIIVSKENWFSIQPTLFFLSKLTPRFKTYFFGENNDDIWNKVDYLITTDPELLEKPSDNKKVIKMLRPYNIDLKADLEINNLIDLVEIENYGNILEEFKKLIGFVNKK